jgi:diguanylate cyclase (GGDEF)-like protein
VLVPAVVDDAELRTLGERLRAAVASGPVALAGRQPRPVTVSVGAARHDGLTHSPELLLRQADSALYAAKRRGRNRVCLHADLVGETPDSREREAA